MADLHQKFKSQTGHQTLVRKLRLNSLVNDSTELAEDIAKHASIVVTPAGCTLIDEGGEDDDLHFILIGQLQVMVQGHEAALLGPGNQVGELSLVDPRAMRSATVRALTDTVTAKVSEETFANLAGKHRTLWRRMSQILGNHLRDSNRLLRQPNPRPRVFIASSPAGMPLARAIAAETFDSDHTVPTWLVETGCHQDASSLTSLASAFTDADFGVIVIAPDDCVRSSEAENSVNRDALFFECGVSIGALGPSRTFLVQPHDLVESAPSTTLGLTPLRYRLDPIDDLKTDLQAICLRIRAQVNDLRSRR